MTEIGNIDTLLKVDSVHVNVGLSRVEASIWLKIGDVTMGPTLYALPTGAVPSLNQFLDEVQVAVEKSLKASKNKGPRQGIIPQEI